MITRENESLGMHGIDPEPVFEVDENWDSKQSPVMRLHCIQEMPAKSVISCTIEGLVHTSDPGCLPHPKVLLSAANRFGCVCAPQRLPWAKYNAVLGTLEVVKVCAHGVCGVV